MVVRLRRTSESDVYGRQIVTSEVDPILNHGTDCENTMTIQDMQTEFIWVRCGKIQHGSNR